MKYGLFRDSPFRPLFADGEGFSQPRRDESRKLWTFSSERAAVLLRSALRHDDSSGFVQIERITRLQERMRHEYTDS